MHTLHQEEGSSKDKSLPTTKKSAAMHIKRAHLQVLLWHAADKIALGSTTNISLVGKPKKILLFLYMVAQTSHLKQYFRLSPTCGLSSHHHVPDLLAVVGQMDYHAFCAVGVKVEKNVQMTI